MAKFIVFCRMLQYLIDEENMIQKAIPVLKGLLEAQSPRLSLIAEKMPGLTAANYKAIQRFLEQVDLKTVLLRLFQELAEFVIDDLTEIVRPQAKKTDYLCRLFLNRRYSLSTHNLHPNLPQAQRLAFASNRPGCRGLKAAWL
jgi:hypothetical protein